MKKITLRSGLLATTTLLSSFAIPALVAGVAVSLPTAAEAQDLTNGALSGTVKSDGGQAAAGAKVTITGTTNGYTVSTKTAADGTFHLNQIPPGHYTVDIVTASGGKASESVTVTLGAVSNYDFTTGSSTGEVIVRGKARRNIDFNRTTTGQVVDVQAMADNIPIARNLASVVDTVPGISINANFGTPPVGQPSISGASPGENIYYIDGMNVTNFRNFLGGSTIPFDFYDQIEVKTGGYSAEFGRATGGALIATSRSGSNTFHGGLSYYSSPKSMQTKGSIAYYDHNGTTPQNVQNYNGGDMNESVFWLSGPLWKDHIFFFGFYNPRDLTTTSLQKYDLSGNVTETETYVNKNPFYGGKLTFQLNPQHRVDFTYIDDNETQYFHDDIVGNGSSLGLNGQGGLTRIVKYTGRFTDWFSLTAMYGSSGYNQTSSSTVDNVAAVYDNGIVVRGNPNLTVEAGKDYRKNMRVDADFYFNLAGRHHLRIGADEEKLNAVDVTQYSGGTYYRYYYPTAGNTTVSCGGFATTSTCVRVRQIFGGGSFNVINDSAYLEDDWTITDRINLNIGLRNDTFDNRNAANKSFIKSENLVSPRLGVSYDLLGDKTTKVTAFVGRYYLPIAANTNLRMAGGESFTEKYYTYSGRDATTLVPTLGTWLNPDPSDYVLEDGQVPSADTLVSHNIQPQSEDEFVLGYEKRLDNGWRIGVHALFRKLNNVMEDTDLDYSNTPVCGYLGISNADCGTFGSSGYVLNNPGKDYVITLGSDFGGGWAGKTVTIPNSVVGMPAAKRDYSSLEFDFERPDNGKWALGGSLVLSRDYGNDEGGVKSDNGQTDTGLTQDFDQVGWMDGSTGLLPNHHGIVFKTHGTYHLNDKLRFGFNYSMVSPRHYGCIGYYPTTADPDRADSKTLTAWYCNGKLTPRGSQFKGDWINTLDVSAGYDIPVAFGKIRLGVDIFNVLDAQGVSQYGEFGEISGPNTPNLNYKKPLYYQEPRYVQLSVKYSF
ncbi:TonB-dependent receptor [Asticcacaulis solisilvae]|uniref:TonB-dependent receptor n=1 Tax=Asticcacaulis solisilvae TaxID=1217274 RepID=UPI003FD8FD6D